MQVADSLGIQSRMQGWGGAMRACVGVRTSALPGRQHASWAPCLGSQSIRGSWKATSPPSNQVCMSRLQAQRPGCACTKQVAAPPPALSGLMLPMGSCQLNTYCPNPPRHGHARSFPDTHVPSGPGAARWSRSAREDAQAGCDGPLPFLTAMKKERGGGGGRGGSSPSCNASHRLLAANNVLPTSVPTQFKHARIPEATYLQAQGLHSGGVLARSFHQLLHRPRPEHKGREGGEQDAGAVHPAQGWEGVQDHLHSGLHVLIMDTGSCTTKAGLQGLPALSFSQWPAPAQGWEGVQNCLHSGSQAQGTASDGLKAGTRCCYTGHLRIGLHDQGPG